MCKEPEPFASYLKVSAIHQLLFFLLILLKHDICSWTLGFVETFVTSTNVQVSKRIHKVSVSSCVVHATSKISASLKAPSHDPS